MINRLLTYKNELYTIIMEKQIIITKINLHRIRMTGDHRWGGS